MFSAFPARSFASYTGTAPIDSELSDRRAARLYRRKTRESPHTACFWSSGFKTRMGEIWVAGALKPHLRCWRVLRSASDRVGDLPLQEGMSEMEAKTSELDARPVRRGAKRISGSRRREQFTCRGSLHDL